MLLRLASAQTVSTQAVEPRGDRAQETKSQCESELQRAFIDLLVQYEFALPNNVGQPAASGAVRPDFAFHADGSSLAVFVEDASLLTATRLRNFSTTLAGQCCDCIPVTTGCLECVSTPTYSAREGSKRSGIRSWKSGHGPRS